QWAPLLALSGVRFVSLQKDLRDSDAATFGDSAVIDLRGELKDFADTAAVIAQLDLVITVDTAVAHLAAAMGKPVWVLLPRVPDFRWLLDRDTSPWYPSARLFRKSRPRDWDEVMTRVARELAICGGRPLAARPRARSDGAFKIFSKNRQKRPGSFFGHVLLQPHLEQTNPPH